MNFRKILTVLSLIVIFVCCSLGTLISNAYEEYINYTTTYVYTPNNSLVTVFQYESEFSPDNIVEHDCFIEDIFPNAIIVSPCSRYYNCHSYAWYMQSPNNPYWMDNPTAYYTDYSYINSIGNVGDIITYIDTNGDIVHSGIIVSRITGTSNGVCDDSNLVMVLSKWGEYGLILHRGDYCPYVSTFGGNAVGLRYFQHNHSYLYTSLGTTQHKGTCSCGDEVTEDHDYNTYIDYSETKHKKKCGKCGYYILESHNFISSGRFRICTTCGAHYPISGNVPEPYGYEENE